MSGETGDSLSPIGGEIGGLGRNNAFPLVNEQSQIDSRNERGITTTYRLPLAALRAEDSMGDEGPVGSPLSVQVLLVEGKPSNYSVLPVTPYDEQGYKFDTDDYDPALRYAKIQQTVGTPPTRQVIERNPYMLALRIDRSSLKTAGLIVQVDGDEDNAMQYDFTKGNEHLARLGAVINMPGGHSYVARIDPQMFRRYGHIQFLSYSPIDGFTAGSDSANLHHEGETHRGNSIYLPEEGIEQIGREARVYLSLLPKAPPIGKEQKLKY